MRTKQRTRVILLTASVLGVAALARAGIIVVNTEDTLERGNCDSLCSLTDALMLATTGDIVLFNIPGIPAGDHPIIDPTTGPPPFHAFNIPDDVTVDGGSQPDTPPGFPGVELRNAGIGVGAFGTPPGATLTRVVVNTNSLVGAAPGSRITGCYIGTDWTGMTAMIGSGYREGIEVDGDGVTIDHNLIVGSVAVLITSNNNVVKSNFINTNIAGTACIAPANNNYSVGVNGNNNAIGDAGFGQGNLICGSFTSAATGVILLGNGNLVQGNSIGLDATGDAALPLSTGVEVSNGTNNVIGGAAGNAIVADFGVVIGTDAVNTSVQANFIGTDTTGTVALASANAYGITDTGMASVIGGTGPAAGNVISGNKFGIYTDSNTLIQENLIGVDAVTGVNPLPNTQVGVWALSLDAVIRQNVIAYNNSSDTPGWGGILIDNAASFDLISRNSMWGNLGRGIVLGGSLSPPPNDNFDGDSGANDLQNYPIVNSADSNGTITTIQGTLNSTANTDFTVEFFSNVACDPSGFGQGALFLGATVVTTDASCHVSFSFPVTPVVPPGLLVTATATNPLNDTSEFSGCKVVTGTGPAAISVDSITPDSGPSAGGTRVVIAGQGFVSGATVKIGGVSATGVSTVTPARITATTPAVPAGTLDDVTVSEGALSATLTKGWFSDFLDVPQGDIFHSYVEKVFRNGITAGCGGGNYCRNAAVRRDQMAVFLLKAEHGSSYTPPGCTGVFPDVPCPGTFADWIEQLAAENITGGCGSGNYCPGNPVTRQQMAVFLLKTEHGSSYMPPACAGIFGDVACPSQFADWIEQLYAENVTGGCSTSPLLYCPTGSNTRGQMAVFLVKSFNLP